MSEPACGDCGQCALCDAVLAYEDRACAERDAWAHVDAVAHHLQAARDFAANADDHREDDDADGLDWCRSRVRGHLVRAAVALLTWGLS